MLKSLHEFSEVVILEVVIESLHTNEEVARLDLINLLKGP